MMATVNCRKAQDLCGRLEIDSHPKFLWGNVFDSETKKELEGYVNIPIAELRQKIKGKKGEMNDAIGKLNNTVNALNEEVRANEKKAEVIVDETNKQIKKIVDEEG